MMCKVIKQARFGMWKLDMGMEVGLNVLVHPYTLSTAARPACSLPQCTPTKTSNLDKQKGEDISAEAFSIFSLAPSSFDLPVVETGAQIGGQLQLF
jgi:hypothetical protein